MTQNQTELLSKSKTREYIFFLKHLIILLRLIFKIFSNNFFFLRRKLKRLTSIPLFQIVFMQPQNERYSVMPRNLISLQVRALELHRSTIRSTVLLTAHQMIKFVTCFRKSSFSPSLHSTTVWFLLLCSQLSLHRNSSLQWYNCQIPTGLSKSACDISACSRYCNNPLKYCPALYVILSNFTIFTLLTLHTLQWFVTRYSEILCSCNPQD